MTVWGVGGLACAAAITFALLVPLGGRELVAGRDVTDLLRWLGARILAPRGWGAPSRDGVAVLQLIHAAMRSGSAIPEALRLAAQTDDHVARVFAAAVREFELGAPLADALETARRATRDDGVRLAIDALMLSVSEALPLVRATALLHAALDRVVFEQRLGSEVRARTSGLRSQIWLLAGLVPAIALYLIVTMPGLAQTLTTPLARFALLPAAVALEITGIVMSRRIVRGVT